MCTPCPVPDPSGFGDLPRRQHGVTLVELIVAIVVISVGLLGILSAFNVSVRGSADPMLTKQLVSIAEALLEEVQQAPFTYCDPDDPKAETATSSAIGGTGCAALSEGVVMGPEAGDVRPFDNVNDYNGFNALPITDIAGAAIPGLAGYAANIAVVPVALNGIAAASGDALRITVTVTAPNGQTFLLDGFRTRFAPNDLP